MFLEIHKEVLRKQKSEKLLRVYNPHVCIPLLKVDCGEPMPPSNGTVTVLSGTLYGAEVSYECNTGFKLDGNASNVCNLTGQWEQGTPTCQPLGDENLTGD